MGMPVSNYTVLRALGYGGEKYEKQAAIKALEGFKLFAIIIHDPETDPEFDQYLQETFNRLDYITGDSLLFFALTDPSPEWLNRANRRAYYQQLSWEFRALINPDNGIFSVDKGLTAFSLANSLNIPNKQLPSIVVTSDFRSDKFFWFKTSKILIREQLEELGYIASEQLWDNRDFHVLEQILKSTKNLYNKRTIHLEENLARTLSDVLSFLVSSDENQSWSIRNQSQKQVQENISKLYNKLQERKQSLGNYSYSRYLDKISINILALLSHLNQDRTLNLNQFISVDKTFLEDDSYKILKTAHRVSDLLASNKLQNLGLTDDYQEELDYSPGVICLSKVFEKEINLSMVHWIRQKLGIELPRYFCKPQPSIRATYKPTNIPRATEINFNKNKHGKWLPPGVGQSEITCREMSQLALPDEWDSYTLNLLMSNWKKIREKRNAAAHTELVDENSFINVKQALEALSGGDIFQKLYFMKTEYRGY